MIGIVALTTARNWRRIRRSVWVCLFIALALLVAGSGASAAVRERESFNDGWRFLKADQPGAEQPDYDDHGWRELNLPHDWGIEGPFDQSYAGETAKLPYWGVGWYRKHFKVSAQAKDRRFYLDVDGAMSNAKVWLNGKEVGGWPYGYTSWRVDLTPHIRFGAENVIAIRLDNPPDSSRWYPGGGIYRNVWLVETGPIHVAHWGTQITTPEVSRASAKVRLAVTLENHRANVEQVSVVVSLQEIPDSSIQQPKVVASTIEGGIKLGAGDTAKTVLDLTVTNPRLWSVDDPQRYVAILTVEQNGEVLDRVETPFGVRTIQFTAAEGFLLNSNLTEIKGACLHHDLGALGAAFNLRARERQLELLKEMGCNAVRSSHNPPEPELLDLCDRMGFLVMDEAFDAWHLAKRENDYHLWFDAWHERDLRAMIRRDRNHPSVIMWSLGNEVYEQHGGTNAWMARQLADIAHQEDATRPVNMALHVVAAHTNGFQKPLDVFGYNYTPFGYAQFRRDNPNQPLIASETSSCVSSRGEYFFPVEDNKKKGRVNFQITSYDLAAPSWAYPPDVEFAAQDRNAFVAGDFVWTGFDYLGEPTPFDSNPDKLPEFTDPALKARAEAQLEATGRVQVPSRSSYFGIYDLCGFRKDRFYSYQARWRPDLPMVHILPHWNWPERVGQVTPVHVYTSGDEAELFLNGRSLGRRKKGNYQYRLRWDDVIYEPGELRVVAYRNGKKWAGETVQTTGAPLAVKLEADRSKITADGKDLAFVTVRVVDEKGLVVPRSHNRIEFEVDGAGVLVATDNGDATSHEPFAQNERNAFNGLCLVIIRGEPGFLGRLTLRAASEGLKGDQLTIVARKP